MNAKVEEKKRKFWKYNKFSRIFLIVSLFVMIVIAQCLEREWDIATWLILIILACQWLVFIVLLVLSVYNAICYLLMKRKQGCEENDEE